MSYASSETQNTTEYADAKEKATQTFLEQLKSNWQAFWDYTEETGQSDTKPFDGIL